MNDHGDEDLVVVSDLHLGPGRLECVETFFNDTAFVRFIDHLCRRAEPEGRRWRLVILGDFLDFLRSELVTNEASEAPGEAAAMTSVERIVAGHPEVSAALGRFLASGFAIDIVVGNHDAELVRPRVQDRLRRVLAETGAGNAAQAVVFHPWLFHVPGIVYAEHGNQHDPFNCFTTVVMPFRDHDAGPLERPVGSHLLEASERLMGSLDPCPDHASSMLRYFNLALRHRPDRAAEVLRRQGEILAGALRHAKALSGPEWAARRRAYRDECLRSYADEVGLSYETTLALDDISMASERPLSLLVKQAVKTGARRAGPAVGLTAAGLAATRVQTRALAMAGPAFGVVASKRNRRAQPPTGRRVGYLQRAAARIHARLASEGSGVRYYVFAHTHAAQHLPLDFGTEAPQYLNTGTWSSLAPPGSDTLRTVLPTFVHIARRQGSRPVARLLAWNGATGSAETLRFQA